MKKLSIGLLLAFLFSNQLAAQCTCDAAFATLIGNCSNVTIIGSCNPGYNCHGFTEDVMTGTCPKPSATPVPYSSVSCPSGVASSTVFDSRFIQMCAGSPHDAVLYSTSLPSGLSDTHSAVFLGNFLGVDRYASKFGCDGPLVYHGLGVGCFYTVNSTTFLTYIGSNSISGSTATLGCSTRNFTVSGTKPGLTYTWSADPGITIVSGANSTTVTVRGTQLFTGNHRLYLTISSGCQTVTRSVLIPVNAGCCNTDGAVITGVYVNGGQTRVLNTYNGASAGTVNVKVCHPTASRFTWTPSPFVSTTLNTTGCSVTACSMTFTLGSSPISFEIRALNASNAVLATRNVVFNPGGFMAAPQVTTLEEDLALEVDDRTSSTFSTSGTLIRAYPNPTGQLLNVETDSGLGFKGMLYNTLGALVRSISIPSGGQNTQIDCADLPEGVYQLHLTNVEERFVQKIMVQR